MARRPGPDVGHLASRSAGERAEGYPARGSEANGHATTIRRSLDPLDPAWTRCHPGLEREPCPGSRAGLREATRRHRDDARDGSGPSLAHEGRKTTPWPWTQVVLGEGAPHPHARTGPKPAGQSANCPCTERDTCHPSLARHDILRAIKKTEFAPPLMEHSRAVQRARCVHDFVQSSPSTERRKGWTGSREPRTSPKIPAGRALNCRSRRLGL